MINDITFCELREKEVVNTIDGKKLGRIIDMVITCTGEVVGLVVCKYLFLILQAFFEEIFAKYSKYHIKNHY